MKKTNTLSGLRALDDETFEIEFKKPFRAALTNLAGSRMAAYTMDNGEILGTGPYMIKEIEDKKLVLTLSPHSIDDVAFKKV